jgi:hypothetical protein
VVRSPRQHRTQRVSHRCDGDRSTSLTTHPVLLRRTAENPAVLRNRTNRSPVADHQLPVGHVEDQLRIHPRRQSRRR